MVFVESELVDGNIEAPYATQEISKPICKPTWISGMEKISRRGLFFADAFEKVLEFVASGACESWELINCICCPCAGHQVASLVLDLCLQRVQIRVIGIFCPIHCNCRLHH